VNAAFKQAAAGKLKGILEVSEEPLVSVDYIGSLYSSVVDGMSTAVNRRDAGARLVVVRQRDGLLLALRGPPRVPRTPALKKKSLRDLPPQALDGKRALVRVDFNVPLKNCKVTDDTRLRASLPRFSICARRARASCCSHISAGRRAVPTRSTR